MAAQVVLVHFVQVRILVGQPFSATQIFAEKKAREIAGFFFFLI